MNLFLKISLLLFTFVGVLYSKTIEIDVHGMTCAFCVDSLQTKLTKLPNISKVDVSLKFKKVRIQTEDENPDIELIKRTVINAGFTPIKLIIKDNEN